VREGRARDVLTAEVLAGAYGARVHVSTGTPSGAPVVLPVRAP
jgi:ABC-type hemin transport system ATPase subunit